MTGSYLFGSLTEILPIKQGYMKITPLEIRQKTFEKNLRGYDKDEVNAFLGTMSQEWEKMLDELKESRMKLESAEREVAKLREVESTLYKTLKTAEDTGNNMIEQANKAAELQLRESQLQAEGLLYEARTKSKEIVEEAEVKSQQILDEIEGRVKELIQEYRSLMIHKDNFSSDLARIAAELQDRAERVKKLNEGFNPENYLAKAKKELFSSEPLQEPQRPVHSAATEKKPEAPAIQKKESESFFDQIG